jgi:hypothetical protein
VFIRLHTATANIIPVEIYFILTIYITYILIYARYIFIKASFAGFVILELSSLFYAIQVVIIRLNRRIYAYVQSST